MNKKPTKSNEIADYIISEYNRHQKKNPTEPLKLLEFLKLSGFNTNQVYTHFKGMKELRAAVQKKFPDSVDYNTEETKKGLLKWYCSLYNKLGGTPSAGDIRDDGAYTMSMVSNHFGGIAFLEERARETYPEKFKDISLDSIKTMTRINELKADIKNYKKFVITTAVAGSEPHMPFLRTLRKFCSDNAAKLIILVCQDPGRFKNVKFKKDGIVRKVAPKIHEEFAKETVLLHDVFLNNNLVISNLKIQAKQIKPTTGFGRVSKKVGSVIFAAPKFSLEHHSVRNNKEKLPHFIATTGAVTVPSYRPIEAGWYQGLRTAYFAEHDHKLGAYYVEIESEEIFHHTQIECKTNDGKIFFRGQTWKENQEAKPARAEAFVMGDLHAGVTDERVASCWDEVIDITRPKRIIIHDGFNGTSVNGHIENDVVSKIIRAINNKDIVVDEVQTFANSLKHWSTRCEELLIVPSNHNDWLERWLRKGNFLKDGNLKNAMPAIKMIVAMVEQKKNPLQYAVEEIVGLKLPNIKWLGRNDDYIVEGIQINCHGDISKNGSRGSLVGMANSYVASFSGHSHTAGILFDAWGVGTSGPLQEEFNNGPGTWTNTSGLIYKYGGRSLVNVIDGKWKTV
jgi:hypothetical protein